MMKCSAAVDPTLLWDWQETELWMNLVTQDRYIASQHADIGHMLSVRQIRVTAGAGKTAQIKEAPKQVCWEFNALAIFFSASMPFYA